MNPTSLRHVPSQQNWKLASCQMFHSSESADRHRRIHIALCRGRGGQLGGNPHHTAAVPCAAQVPSPHAAMGGGHRYSDISLTIAQRFSCTLHLENARAIAKRMPDERVRLGSTLSSQVLAWTM